MMVIGLLQTADKMAQKEPRAPMAVKMFITQPLDACHGRWDRAGKSVDFPFAVRVRTRPDSSPPRIPFRAGPAAVASCCGPLCWMLECGDWDRASAWLSRPFAWSRLGTARGSAHSASFFLHAPASFGILLGPFAALIAIARKGGRRRRASATSGSGLGRFLADIV